MDSDSFNLRCIISDVNGNKYCVRDRSKLELAADRLATINNKMNELVTHVGKKYPDQEKVPRPPHWSGWRLIPREIEFWLEIKNRVHERLNYK